MGLTQRRGLFGYAASGSRATLRRSCRLPPSVEQLGRVTPVLHCEDTVDSCRTQESGAYS